MNLPGTPVAPGGPTFPEGPGLPVAPVAPGSSKTNYQVFYKNKIIPKLEKGFQKNQ